MQLEDLCQKMVWSHWERNRLTIAHPSRPAEPRTTRLPARLKLFSVPYSANRLKYPLMRKRLMKMWREKRNVQQLDPVGLWASIIEDADKAKLLTSAWSRRFRSFSPGAGSE
ncbi:hypothetical protein ACPA9J_23990 [Pseudomonas aeruginosa]